MAEENETPQTGERTVTNEGLRLGYRVRPGDILFDRTVVDYVPICFYDEASGALIVGHVDVDLEGPHVRGGGTVASTVSAPPGATGVNAAFSSPLPSLGAYPKKKPVEPLLL